MKTIITIISLFFGLLTFMGTASAQETTTCHDDIDGPACLQDPTNPTNIIGKHYPTEADRQAQWAHDFNGWDFYWDADTDSAFYDGKYGQEVGDQGTRNTVPYQFWFDNPHDDDLDDDIDNSGACKFHFNPEDYNGTGAMIIDRIKEVKDNTGLPCPVRPYLARASSDRAQPVTGRYNTGALTRRDEHLKQASTLGATYEFRLKVRDHSEWLEQEYPSQTFFKKYGNNVIGHQSEAGDIIQQDAIMAYFNGPPLTTNVASSEDLESSSSVALYISPPMLGTDQAGCIKLYRLDLLTPNKRGCRDVVVDILDEGFVALNGNIPIEDGTAVELIPTTDPAYNSNITYEFRYKLMLQNLGNTPIYNVKLFNGDGQLIHQCVDEATEEVDGIGYKERNYFPNGMLDSGRICAKLPPRVSFAQTEGYRSEYDIAVQVKDIDIESERVSVFAYAEYQTSNDPTSAIERVEVTKVTTIPKSISKVQKYLANGEPDLDEAGNEIYIETTRWRKERYRVAEQAFTACSRFPSASRPACYPHLLEDPSNPNDVGIYEISNVAYCLGDPDKWHASDAAGNLIEEEWSVFDCPFRGYVPAYGANHDWITVTDVPTTDFNTYRVSINPITKRAQLYINGNAYGNDSSEPIPPKVINSTVYVTTYEPSDPYFQETDANGNPIHLVPPSGDSQYEFPTFVIGDNAANVEADVDGWPDFNTSLHSPTQNPHFDGTSLSPPVNQDFEDWERQNNKDVTARKLANLEFPGLNDIDPLYHPGNLDISGAYELDYYAYRLGHNTDATLTSRTTPSVPYLVVLEREAAGIEFDYEPGLWEGCKASKIIIGEERRTVRTHTTGSCPRAAIPEKALVADFLAGKFPLPNGTAALSVNEEGHLRALKTNAKIRIPTLPRYKTMPIDKPSDEYCNAHICGSDHWSIELRAKFLADDDTTVNLTSDETSEDAFAIKVFDHLGTYWVMIDTNSVKAGLGGKYVGRTHPLTMDTTDKFHTYRLVRKKNEPYVYLFIDGEERAAIPDMKMTSVQKNGTKFRPWDVELSVGGVQQIVPDEWRGSDYPEKLLQGPIYKRKGLKDVKYSVEIDYIRWSDEDVTTLGDELEEINNVPIATQRLTFNYITEPMSETNDLFKGFAGNDHITGRLDGDDFIYGGHGNDRLYGRKGADLVYGGPGLDNIYAGNYGEADSDVIILDAIDSSHDFIRNFQPEWDKIIIRGIANQSELNISLDGSDTIIEHNISEHNKKLLAKVIGLSNPELLQYTIEQ